MEPLISFTLMLNQLTDIELNQFLTNIIKTSGTELISKLFFSYFADNQSKIEPFAKNITNIINARKNKEKEQLIYECIDKLPSVLIGECASYLLEKEYFRFAQCNRQIYVSTNNPLKLYKISCDGFQKYPQSMSMDKFKSIKQLAIDIPYFNEHISDSNQLILKDFTLNTLILSNSHCKKIKEFCDKNPFRFNQIKKMSLSDFGKDSSLFNAKSFGNLLSSLVKVEHLELLHIYLTPFQFKKNDIIKWFPNLKYLKCRPSADINLCQQLINTFSNQLESLSLSKPQYMEQTKSLMFPKLKELCIEIFSLEQLNIFKNVKSLKKATIQTSDKYAAAKSITFLLETQSLIEKIQICTKPQHFEYIFKTVQSTLYNVRNHEKNELFIGLIFYGADSVNDEILKSIPFQMCTILNMFEKTKITDYIVYIRLEHKEHNNHKNTMKNVLCDLNEMKKDYLVNWDINKNNMLNFIGSNKECKINGYGIEYMWGLKNV